MNYTKTIREYCLKNEGTIFDSKQMARDYFPMVPYKTFMKILNRLQDEGILSPVSKGVWLVDRHGSEHIDTDAAILEQYAGGLRGMVVGYAMYNEIGVSTHKEETVRIYTKMIPDGSHKNIGKYHLTGADILFTGSVKRLLRTLELIEAGTGIEDVDYLRYHEIRLDGLGAYSDPEFEEICRSIRYQYSTIVTLDLLLKDTDRYPNNCLNIYKQFDQMT